MHTRFATAADVPAIVDIINWAVANTPANFSYEPYTVETFAKDWQTDHAMYPWYVATDGERVAGYCRGLRFRPRSAYAWTAELSIYIHPEFHGRGVGKLLYTRLIRTLTAQGYRRLLGSVTIPNAASERLHESFGFRRAAHFDRQGWKFGRWHDVCYFELSMGGDATPGAIRPVREVDGGD